MNAFQRLTKYLSELNALKQAEKDGDNNKLYLSDLDLSIKKTEKELKNTNKDQPNYQMVDNVV